jgi:hypothetical protein
VIQKIVVITGLQRGAMPRSASRLLRRGFALVINRTLDASEAAAFVARLRRANADAKLIHIDAQGNVQ